MLNPNLSLYPDSVFPWIPETSNNKIESGVSREVFVTGNRSLYLENQDSLLAYSSSWTQTYTGPMPAQGSTLELTAFVKGENIRDLTVGGNIHIGFKVLPWKDPKLTTEPRGAFSGLELQGDFDWVLMKATLEDFPEDAESIQVTLHMPTLTLGKVYFDEITLTVK